MGSRFISAARTCLSGRNRQTVRGRFFVTCSTRFQRRNNRPLSRVFRVVGIASLPGYGAAQAQASIWSGRIWVVTLKHLFDSVIYALLTKVRRRELEARCCSGARRGERLSGQTANGSNATVARFYGGKRALNAQQYSWRLGTRFVGCATRKYEIIS